MAVAGKHTQWRPSLLSNATRAGVWLWLFVISTTHFFKSKNQVSRLPLHFYRFHGGRGTLLLGLLLLDLVTMQPLLCCLWCCSGMASSSCCFPLTDSPHFGLDLQVSETFVFRWTKPALAHLLQPEDAHSSRLRLTVEAGSL